MKIGVFYGSTSYGTKEAAELVFDELRLQASGASVELVNVARRKAEDLAPYDLVVFGTSTWGSGGLQHDWDAFIWELKRADLAGKSVAVFALGDQVVWSATFVDSMAVIHDAAAGRGAVMLGYWPTEGYEFDRSQSVRGGRFLGLALDRINQRGMSAARIGRWVSQLLIEMRGPAEAAGEAPPVVVMAPAKVNLSLLVGPRGDDGYHPLLTVFVSLDLCDELEFRLVAAPAGEGGADATAPGRGGEVACPGIRPESNLATRALRLVEDATGWRFQGAARIRKHIPAAAGLGGGSSDAACTLTTAANIVATAGGPVLEADVLLRLACRLGADVPFFLDPRPTLARGRGDQLSALPLPSFPLVLLLPQEELPTASVYEEFDLAAADGARNGTGRMAGGRGSVASFAADSAGDERRWKALSAAWEAGELADEETAEKDAACLLRNDLEPAALRLLPRLAERRDALLTEEALGVLMSGSGPTMFGMWGRPEEAARAAERLTAAGHCVRLSLTRGSDPLHLATGGPPGIP
jgi:flavodoxin long chain